MSAASTAPGASVPEASRDGPLIAVERATKAYPVHFGLFSRRHAVLRAVDDVSLAVEGGRTLGVVGESGCGKTTLSRLILRQERPTSGTVRFRGRNLWQLSRRGESDFHRSVTAVFQDPYTSLNPRHRVAEIVMEPAEVNLHLTRPEKQERLASLIREVGLPPEAVQRYPHEFSGGQRQRIAIARALSLEPELIVLDEPVSALDVSIRAQVLNLLRDLQQRHGVAYVFIAHDLAVVQYMSDVIAVMYLGIVVELAAADALYERPKHPYTRALLEASLPPDPHRRDLTVSVYGEVPSPIDPPSGCRFRTRCPIAIDRCALEVPPLRELESGHVAACHLAE